MPKLSEYSSNDLGHQSLLAKALRVNALGLDLAVVRADKKGLFASELYFFVDESLIGQLLQQMNVPIPNLPPYDPAKDEKMMLCRVERLTCVF